MPLSGAGIIYVMAVLSGTRVVRVLWVWEAVSCCATACVGAGAAADCDRRRLVIPTESSMRCLVCVVPLLVRRESARSVDVLSGTR